jgi:hypothetical protein
MCGRSLVPLVKTRDFGMTPRDVIVEDFKLSHYALDLTLFVAVG